MGTLHGSGGPLTEAGVIAAAERINRKRTIREKVEVILEADEQHVRTLSTLVDGIYKEAAVRPKRKPVQD